MTSGRAKNRNGTNVVPSARRDVQHRSAARGRARRPNGLSGGRASGGRPGTAGRSGPHGDGRRARGGTPPRAALATLGEVAEQDAEVRVGSASAAGAERRARYVRGSTPTSWTRRPRTTTVSASSSSSTASRFEVVELRCGREGIPRDGDVVVPEHDVRAFESTEQRPQQRLAARVRDQVAGDADELRSPLRDPGDGAPAACSPARRAEVEVRQMSDREARRVPQAARRARPRAHASAASRPRTSHKRAGERERRRRATRARSSAR